MTVVAQIPPLGSGPGLIGYECPKCVYVTSVLWRRGRQHYLGQSPLTPIPMFGLILRLIAETFPRNIRNRSSPLRKKYTSSLGFWSDTRPTSVPFRTILWPRARCCFRQYADQKLP